MQQAVEWKPIVEYVHLQAVCLGDGLYNIMDGVVTESSIACQADIQDGGSVVKT